MFRQTSVENRRAVLVLQGQNEELAHKSFYKIVNEFKEKDVTVKKAMFVVVYHNTFIKEICKLRL